MSLAILGIDPGKNSWSLAGLDERNGRARERCAFATNPRVCVSIVSAPRRVASITRLPVSGIEQFRATRDLWLDRMLVQPLRRPASGGALAPRINGRRPAE